MKRSFNRLAEWGGQVVTSGGKVVDQMYGSVPDAPHYKNFIDCVKSRKKPNADIRMAHKALSNVILAVIAHRIGNGTVHFDWKNERFIDNGQANKFMEAQGRGEYRMPDEVT